MNTPERIFQMMTAYQQSSVLKGAIELELFTAIAEGANTVPALAQRCGASERGIRIMADYLTVAGLLTKTGDTYALTPDSAMFLDKRQRSYIGSAVGFLNQPFMLEMASDVAEVVRRGTSVAGGRKTLDVEHQMWVDFAKGMMPMMMPAAQYMAGLLGFGERSARLLDIAAGHGAFGIVAAMANPGTQVDALDWPAVLDVAQEHAAMFGVAGRWHRKPGSALEMDYGSGYDAIYLTNFLHHFDRAECGRILEKCRAALAENGRVFTLEFVPNEDRVTPPTQAAFSMTMLLNTPAGDAYTFPEFQEMFSSAGFGHNELHDVPNSAQRLIVSGR